MFVLFEYLVEEEHEVVDARAELSWQADSEFNLGVFSETMYLYRTGCTQEGDLFALKDAAGSCAP